MSNINEGAEVENLENLTNEELDALEAKGNEADGADDSTDTTVDYKAKYEAEKLAREKSDRIAAIRQRLLNKKGKTITNDNKPNSDFTKDILEVRQALKVDAFAEENGLTKAQARKVFEINPNATAETLKDPFIAEGLKAIARKDRVDEATPQGGRVTTVNGKTWKDMSEDERRANYKKVIQG